MAVEVEVADVFVSYNSEDRARLKPLVDALEAEGFSVWWDVHIGAGSHWRETIQEHLDSAKCVIVAWTAHSVGRGGNFVRDEAARAQRRGVYLPICLDPVEPPLGFGEIQALSLKGWSGDRADPRYLAVVSAVRPRVSGGPVDHVRPQVRRPLLSRRGTLVALGGGALAVGAGAYLWTALSRHPVDPEVASLIKQAWHSWAQGTKEGNSQAIGLYRRATSLAPGDPDSWGLLGCAYGDRGHNWVSGAERDEAWLRAREAGNRSLDLDPRNAYGRAAIAYARPHRGNWGLMDREFRRAEHDQPDKWLIVYSLGLLMGEVGRFAEAARLFGRLKGTAPTTTQFNWHVEALWACGRIEEAERLLDQAIGIYGSSPRVWWLRFDMLLYGGRASAALALTEDGPPDLDQTELKGAIAIAHASISHDLGGIDRLLREQAARGGRLAGRAIEYASFLGLIDQAFEIANALYFSRGFAVPDFPPQPGASAQVTLDDRSPRTLFLPSTKALRTDRRFGQLVGELGLVRYWQEIGALPDYRRA